MKHKIMDLFTNSAAPSPLLLHLFHYKISGEDSSLLTNRIPGCGFAGVKEKRPGKMEARGRLVLVLGSLKGEGGNRNRNLLFHENLCKNKPEQGYYKAHRSIRK